MDAAWREGVNKGVDKVSVTGRRGKQQESQVMEGV